MANTVDLRTYVALEKAFVRRLQRSWRIQSAPTYAAITQACLAHKWDEARRLVLDLDMAEVGTENREWITYMLLSCGVFGASIITKRKPSFVGVGTFDTFLKQTTNNILQYLEYKATAQVHAEALQSIAEDEAKTKAEQLKVAFDPNQPRDAEGQWTRGLHLQVSTSKKPERVSTAEFEAKYSEEKRLYLGVSSAAAAERAREGGGSGRSARGIQAFQSVANAQVEAQREERDQGVILRFAIKPEAHVVKLPSRMQFSNPDVIDRWAKEHKADIVNIDDLQYLVKNPAMVAVDTHEYTIRESTVLEYERGGWTLEGYEAEKAAVTAARQAKSLASIPLHQQARALLQHAVGAEIPVGVDDHPVAIRAAQETATILTEMKAKGYKMPREIEVRAMTQQMPSGEATHDILQVKVPDNLPDDVSLDAATLAVYGEKDYDGIDKFVPRTFQQIVVHEMGHINQRPANPRETKAAAKEFEREMWAVHEMPKVANQVSKYANNNTDEFVAEVFTKLYRGDTVSPKIMRVYKGLRGAKIL